MRKIAVILFILLFAFGGLVIAEEDVKVPFNEVKSSCYGQIDMSKAEFLLSEIGKDCVKESWLEANISGEKTQAEETETSEEPVEFLNSEVEMTVKQQLGKAVGDVYPSDLKKLTELIIDYKNIETFEWFKHCENLESLRLRRNGIEDISFLSYLTNLETLVINKNNVSDLSPLSKLHNLSTLHLMRNNITDIQPLVDNFKVKEDGKKVGLGKGDSILLTHNNLDLSEGSEDLQNIQTLLDRGVEVEYHPQKD